MTHALNAPNQAPRWSVALVGNPNCGKTALFNLLTGARQKVANYAGVTVERKVGLTRLKNGRTVSIIDLPGAYSLTPATPDEQITLEVIEGRRHGEAAPDAIVAVVDATNLRMNLRLVLELAQLGRPLMVALNMADVARAEGLKIDVDKLAAELGCPVVETVAVRADGHAELLALLEARLGHDAPEAAERQRDVRPSARAEGNVREARSSADLQLEVRRILAIAAPGASAVRRFQHRIDAVVMHPVWGLVLLGVVLFLMFQAVFSWAVVPMDAIKAAMAGVGEWITAHMADGPLAQPPRRRRDRRRRQRAGLPAADPDPVPVHPRPRGFRLPAARRVPARQPDGQGRPLGARLHPAAVELRLRDPRDHGDADDRQLEGPPGDDHDRAADDVLGAPAGVRAPDRRLRPGDERRPVQPARPDPLRASTSPASSRRWRWRGS